MRNSILKSYLKKFVRSEAFISVIIVFVLAIGIIGTSYALYMDVDTDTDYQLVEVGDLSVGFDNGDNTFTLNYLTPTDDDIATNKVQSDIGKEISEKNFFSFYIYNNGNYTANYNIKLVPQEGSISSEYLRYQICKDNIENCKDIKTLSEVTNNIIFNDELSPNRIETQTNPSAYYFLRVWVKNDYVVKENDKVILKVEIEAKNASGYLDNDNTLAGKLLSDKRVKINNTIPNFTDIADYAITGDKTSGELGLFKAEDDYGISYYYRGAQSYNYVNFAGFTWRVVRINGDGSIRLILDGTLDKVCAEYEKDSDGNCTKYAGENTVFNSLRNNNAYIGYMYGIALNDTVNYIQDRCLKLDTDIITDKIDDDNYNTKEKCESNGGKWTTNAYEATHANLINSTIKTKIDNFYENYIQNNSHDKNYERYLNDTLFCNDKSLNDYGENKGYGTFETYYASYNKFSDNKAVLLENVKPSLKCAINATNNYSRMTAGNSSGENRFDMSTTIGNNVSINNDLKYPIALLNVDEMILAGALINKPNSSYYLNFMDGKEYNEGGNTWWTLSPYRVLSSMPKMLYSRADHFSIYFHDVGLPSGIRPVINLKADTLYKTGDGTSITPYEIK